MSADLPASQGVASPSDDKLLKAARQGDEKRFGLRMCGNVDERTATNRELMTVAPAARRVLRRGGEGGIRGWLT